MKLNLLNLIIVAFAHEEDVDDHDINVSAIDSGGFRVEGPDGPLVTIRNQDKAFSAYEGYRKGDLDIVALKQVLEEDPS